MLQSEYQFVPANVAKSVGSAMNAAAAAKSQENCRVPLNIVRQRFVVVVVIREWEKKRRQQVRGKRRRAALLPPAPGVKRANDKRG